MSSGGARRARRANEQARTRDTRRGVSTTPRRRNFIDGERHLRPHGWRIVARGRDRGSARAQMKTHTLEHRGIATVYYDEGSPPSALARAAEGSGDGAPFVLVHGFTGGKLDFENQIPWFSDRRRVLALDQRGHGDSSNVGRDDAYDIGIQVGDLESFLKGLGVRRCHLLGHSMGGLVAMRFALDHPEYLASLVLMDTSASAPALGSEEERAAFAKVVREHGCEVMLERHRAAVSLPGVQAGIDFLGDEEHWRRIRWKLERVDREAFVGLMEDMTRHDVLAELARVECPTTVLVGEFDTPFIEPSRAMSRTIPDARLVVIPGAAHCPQYENAAAWRAAIDAHLAWSDG